MDEDPPFPVVDCPNCGAGTAFDYDEPMDPERRFWCAECAHDIGAWPEVFARLYGDAWPMMKARLSRQG